MKVCLLCFFVVLCYLLENVSKNFFPSQVLLMYYVWAAYVEYLYGTVWVLLSRVLGKIIAINSDSF